MKTKISTETPATDPKPSKAKRLSKINGPKPQDRPTSFVLADPVGNELLPADVATKWSLPLTEEQYSALNKASSFVVPQKLIDIINELKNKVKYTNSNYDKRLISKRISGSKALHSVIAKKFQMASTPREAFELLVLNQLIDESYDLIKTILRGDTHFRFEWNGDSFGDLINPQNSFLRYRAVYSLYLKFVSNPFLEWIGIKSIDNLMITDYLIIENPQVKYFWQKVGEVKEHQPGGLIHVKPNARNTYYAALVILTVSINSLLQEEFFSKQTIKTLWIN